MDYSKLSTDTLKMMRSGNLDYSKIPTEDLLQIKQANQPQQVKELPSSNEVSPKLQSPQPPLVKPDESEVGALEAIGRGTGQGLSFGFSEEALAAAKAASDQGDYSQLYNQYLETQRAREKQAAEEHPFLYHGSEFLSSLALPFGALKGLKALGFAGEAANVAREISPLAKVGESIATGTGYGALAGAGKSEGKNLEEVAKDTASSAVLGGALGGILSGGIEGLKSTSRYFAKEGGIGSEVAKSAVKGFDENQSIRNVERLKNTLYDEAEKFSNTALKDQLNSISGKMSAAVKAANETGREVDVAPILSELEKLGDSINKGEGGPRAREEFERISSLIKDHLLGVTEKKKVVVPSIPKVIEESVPSSQSQLEKQAAKLTQESAILGENARYEIINKDNNQYLLKILTDQSKNDRVSIVGKIPVSEASQSQLQKQAAKLTEQSAILGENAKYETVNKNNNQYLLKILTDESGNQKASIVGKMPLSEASESQLQKQISRLTEESSVLGENAKYEVVNKGENQYLLKILGDESGQERVSIVGKMPMTEGSPEVLASPLNVKTIEERAGKQVLPGTVKKLEAELGNELYNPKLGLDSVEARSAAQQLDQLVTAATNKSIPGYEQLRTQFKDLSKALQSLGISKEELFTFTPDGEKVLDPDTVTKLGKYIEKSLSNDLSSVSNEKNIQEFMEYLKRAGVENVDSQMEAVKKAAENLKLAKYISGSTVNPLLSAKTMLKGGAYTANLLGQAERNIVSPLIKKLLPIVPRSGLYQDVSKGLQPDIEPQNKESMIQSADILKSVPQTSYLGNNLLNAVNRGGKISQAAAINSISQNPIARKILKGEQ